ncbi:hypothetical protein [Streptomyces sp. NPDC048269]|uniref:hypothetical protein n=1 Tax=Streptomyces sp. NPDC048269 TaxID=3155753 RepID=UPI003448BAAC
MSAAGEWLETRAAVVVTKTDIDRQFVSGVLGLALEDPATSQGADCWVWRPELSTGSVSAGLEEQIDSLAKQLHPRAESVRRLLETGHHVQVDITGTAATGAVLTLSAGLLREVGSLGLPIGLTCLTAAGVPEEDPLSWLDD